jgi:nucleoid-associated protein YgaU
MARLSHGQIVSSDQARQAREGLAAAATGQPMPAGRLQDPKNFDFLFPELQDDPANLLPEGQDTVVALRALGQTMVDEPPAAATPEVGSASIPAVYTYLGQFIDHDITLEQQSDAAFAVGGVDTLFAANSTPQPLSVAHIRDVLVNSRTAPLDLDSVYGFPAPRDPANNDRMEVGTVTVLGGIQPPIKRPARTRPDNREDVPRQGRHPADPDNDRAAKIGDPRNDENTIISQLHVAFLHAHNRLVDEGRTFEQARSILRQHYQAMVLHDFLPTVCDPGIVHRVVQQGNRWYNPLAEPFFMPFEFSVAAFRFGHTMVRSEYDFNLNFNLSGADGTFPASLGLLFTFSALSGELRDNATLPDNWVIEWERIAGDEVLGGGRARRFDTRLAGPKSAALFGLRTVTGSPAADFAAMLSVRNLLRGYVLRMPTGQAVAERLGLPVLSATQLAEAVGATQFAALQGGPVDLSERTPLWYYVLAEAAAKTCGNGERLGPVGSTIVAEVLTGLVRRSADSILRIPGWRAVLPTLDPGNVFRIADLLRFAGVLAGGAPSVYHTVVAGDTLSGIAKAKLGSASRWPEIFAVNRVILARPDRIVPGQKLALPSGPAPVPQLRFHIVTPGETLSGIAQDHLGSASRWPEIFARNGAVLTNPDVIVVGQVLELPPK